MRISEVMQETNLTKKAIYYYEDEKLITPQKDKENGYRNYIQEDIERLNTINTLRKLGFSIKTIKQILLKELDIEKLIKQQLDSINKEINYLEKNKDILERLNENGINSIIDLKSAMDELEKESKNKSGYMKKELERLLPGNMGMLFAIHYGQFLDEPLDTSDKEETWSKLINFLDSLEDIEYPSDIKAIIEEKYKDFTEEDLERLKEKSINITDKILSRKSEVSKEEKEIISKRLEEYENDPYFKEKRENDIKLQQFFLKNLMSIFQEVDKYVCILSSRFKNYNKILKSYKNDV